MKPRPVVLTFHGVGPLLRPIDNGELNCWLEREHFEQVLDLIVKHRHVQLTFDDGNASDYNIALPALLRRGLTATFFVCTSRLDQETFLTKAQVQDLQSHGMVIGSHGADHVAWDQLHPDELERQLEGSRNSLSAICDRPVNRAACPFGTYNHFVLWAARHSGFDQIYTSDGGAAATDDWLIPRTTVTRTGMTDIPDFVSTGPGHIETCVTRLKTLVKRYRPSTAPSQD